MRASHRSLCRPGAGRVLVGWRQRTGWQTWAGALIATVGVFLLGVDDQFGSNWRRLGTCRRRLVGVARRGRRPRGETGRSALVLRRPISCGRSLERPARPVPGSRYLSGVKGSHFRSRELLVGRGLRGGRLRGHRLHAASHGTEARPAADAAIILSMEAVFAALFGYLLLHESLLPRQLLGCA